MKANDIIGMYEDYKTRKRMETKPSVGDFIQDTMRDTAAKCFYAILETVKQGGDLEKEVASQVENFNSMAEIFSAEMVVE